MRTPSSKKASKKSKKSSGGSRRAAVGPDLRAIFRAVDTDGSGQIDADELQTALSNGTWAPFNDATVRLLLKMFDRSNSGGLTFSEFEALWGYMTKWVDTFKAADTDGSGTIERGELRSCLEAFGYRLGLPTIRMLMDKYDRTGAGGLHFDDFVLLCCQLQGLTDVFRDKDTNRSGRISLHYEEFIDMMLNSQLF